MSIVALGTSVPLALIGAVLDRGLELDTSSGHAGLLALLATIVVADIAFIVFGSTFLSALLQQYLHALGDEREDPSWRSVGRAIGVAFGHISMLRLIVADVLVTVITMIGVVLFVVPGLIAALLLWLTGPIMSIEGLGPIAAMRRSVRLSLRGPIGVAVALVVPVTLWSAASSALDLAPFGNWWVLFLSGLLYAPFAALARIVAAQALLARAPAPA